MRYYTLPTTGTRLQQGRNTRDGGDDRAGKGPACADCSSTATVDEVSVPLRLSGPRVKRILAETPRLIDWGAVWMMTTCQDSGYLCSFSRPLFSPNGRQAWFWNERRHGSFKGLLEERWSAQTHLASPHF